MRRLGLRTKGRESAQTPSARATTPLSQAFAQASPNRPVGDDDDDDLEILEDEDLDRPQQQQEADEQDEPEEEVDFFTDQGARNAQVPLAVGNLAFCTWYAR